MSPEELQGVLERLNRVLALVDQLQAVDTRGIEPMAHALDAEITMAQRRREDVVTESDARDALQKVAPATQAGLYLVPRVLE